MSAIAADLEAEQALLGSLLLDGAAWGEVEDLFDPAAFVYGTHRQVAEAVMEVQKAGEGLDAVVVMGKLRDAGQDRAAESVMELARSVGTASGARFYAERLRALYVRREAIAVAQELLAQAGSGDAAIEEAVSKLMRLETGKAVRAEPLQSIIVRRLEALDAQRTAGAGSASDIIPTGFRRLDQLVAGFRPAMPWVIAARPGIGKSALASALIDNVSNQGIPCGVFQLEDEAVALADRAIARRARIASTFLRHGANLRADHWRDILAMKTDHPVWVDDSKGLTARELAARMRRMVRDHGCRWFLVDHLGELELEYRGERDRHDIALGRAARTLRKAAHDLGVALVLLHQLNRETERRAEDSTPKLSDLKDSGDLEAIARVVVFLVRPASVPGGFQMHVAKNTNGPRGIATLSWLEDYMAVVEPKEVA